MRRRAVAVVATQGISPVMAMLVALVIALILLLAAPVKAQETTAEETTVLAADPANMKVEAKTDNVSVKVDNSKVSVSTDDNSSSKKGTSQQSSVTVQQNQTDEGSGSRASTGDVNIGATRTSRIPSGTAATGIGNPPDEVRINIRNCTVSDGASITLEDIDGTEALFRDGTQEIDIFDSSAEVRIEGPANDFIGDHAQLTSPSNEDLSENGDYDVVTSTGITCRRDGNNNDGRNRHRHHDRDRDRNRHRFHDRDRDRNRFFGRGAANQQYTRIVEERVIKETVPDKGRLAATGGVPLTGAAFLGLASVGLGVSILRFAIRRDP
jgi:Tfp pilus assembly protein FimT